MRTSSHGHFPGRAGMSAVVAATALIVSGCGGGGGADPTAGPTTGTASPTAAGVVVNITGTEYSFAPKQLKASAGPTTFRLTNNGAMEHDFVIDALHLHVMARPGKTAGTTVTLKPGTYVVYCSVPGHRQSGMQGTLIVS